MGGIMKTGFIGLGHLGKAMAKRLMSEGVDVVVWNRTKEKAADLGVEVAETPASLIARADRVFLNLFDSDAVISVLTGKSGLLEGGCKGKIIIDTTTNHFEKVLYFHGLLEERGGHYLECPVLGSVVPASQGNLTVLVSGAKDIYERTRPLLEMIGKNIFYLEKPTLAVKMKLINNLVLGAFMTALAEAIALGEKAGIDKAVVIDILSAGAGNSAVLNAKKEKLLKEDFSTHFSSALIYKDLHYLQDLARSMKIPLFTGSITKELFGMTFAKGIADLDLSAVYKIMKEY
jgi:3-hydroxyisobutyrate dehydrogenase